MELDKFVRAFLSTMLWNAAQFAVGSVLAVAVCAAARGNLPRSWRSANGAVISTMMFALCGSLLPWGTYGVLPVALVLVSAGLAVPAAVAFLLSNRFFNMLVPFADPTFVWTTGYPRAILAVIAGAAAGLLILSLGNRGGSLLRFRAVQSDPGSGFGAGNAARLVGGLAWKAAVVLVLGAALDTLFRGFILGEIVGFLFTNNTTGPLASSFAQRNVVNPIFLLGTWCITVLTDFVGLSGLALVMKPKTLLLSVAYCAALAAVLCSSVLFL
jgi:uncharacterized membrane protein YraQ (UPF0718 family)